MPSEVLPFSCSPSLLFSKSPDLLAGCPLLLIAKLGMLVDVPSPCDHLLFHGRGPLANLGFKRTGL